MQKVISDSVISFTDGTGTDLGSLSHLKVVVVVIDALNSGRERVNSFSSGCWGQMHTLLTVSGGLTSALVSIPG